MPSTRVDQGPAESRLELTPELARPAVAAPQITPFSLTEVVVEGSSLPAESLAARWRPYMGATVDGAALGMISDAIVAAYQDSDIALYTVLVPDQTFADGVLRVQVVEGFVQDISIEGGDGRVQAAVRRYLTHTQAAGERPLKKSTLQRALSLTRDLPGLKAMFDLQPEGVDGGVKLVAKLDHSPVQVGVAVNNRGTTLLGRTQVSTDLYLNDVAAPGGQTRFSFAAPTDFERFQYYAASHTQVVGESGAAVQAGVGYLRTRPEGTTLTGRATSLGGQVSLPLLRNFRDDLRVTVGLDGIDARSALVGTRISDDRTRALRAAVAYARQAARTSASLSGAVSFGLDALGARTFDPGVSDLAFVKLNGRGAFAYQFADAWIVRLSGAAQWSGDRLPAVEQFALGGAEFGRAYEAAVTAGDYGYAGSSELAFRPRLPASRLSEAEAYVFADGGKSWYRGRLGYPTSSAGLGSLGIGVRGAVNDKVALQLEGTRAFDNAIPELDRGRWRAVFSVRTLW